MLTNFMTGELPEDVNIGQVRPLLNVDFTISLVKVIGKSRKHPDCWVVRHDGSRREECVNPRRLYTKHLPHEGAYFRDENGVAKFYDEYAYALENKFFKDPCRVGSLALRDQLALLGVLDVFDKGTTVGGTVPVSLL